MRTARRADDWFDDCLTVTTEEWRNQMKISITYCTM